MERRERYRQRELPTLDQMRATSEALKGVERACDITHAKPEFVEFVRTCSPAAILNLLNEHATLVEQRDLLIDIARDALRFREEMNGKCDHDEAMTKLCTQCEIRAVLATVEQGGDSSRSD